MAAWRDFSTYSDIHVGPFSGVAHKTGDWSLSTRWLECSGKRDGLDAAKASVERAIRKRLAKWKKEIGDA